MSKEMSAAATQGSYMEQGMRESDIYIYIERERGQERSEWSAV